jgi:hypothetical protein
MGDTVYRRCDYCGKCKPEAVMLTAGEGQRAYCNERELERGERAHKAADSPRRVRRVVHMA